MKHKIILILIIACVLISGGILISETVYASGSKPDLVEINKIKIYTETAADLSSFQFASDKYDFMVVSFPDGVILYETKRVATMGLTERLNQAITNYDTVLDYEPDGNLSGKIIIYTGQSLQGNRTLHLLVIIIPFTILCALLCGYYFYMRVFLYSPFKRMKKFALDIAVGNLELALPMDRDNLFGEFTESFDIMRDELKAARQKAAAAENGKKELVAAISHDIKTPLSIIRTASELLELGEIDKKRLNKIKAIQAKTVEIDTLITDLFSLALEDLSELKIDVKDIEAAQIERLIELSDPLKKTTIVGSIPQYLLRADLLRLGQVFGNIISNSYKYAGTKIEVSFTLIDRYLKISFKDFGTTLTQEELPLLKTKFYRGKNAESKQGAGLGLYICSKILENMGGGLGCEIEPDGFRADVSLALS